MSQESLPQTTDNTLLNQGASLVSTTCPYCGVGCGIDISVSASKGNDKNDGKVMLTGLTGTLDHPANFGRLCVKGAKLLETNCNSGRMQVPKIMGQQVSWTKATAAIANKFNAIIAKHGADSIAFYVSGQLLTEDYYVANKLMKGYIGSANIDTNSRLCMSSAVAAYKRAFGADAVPCCYEDLELTDVLVLVGSNAAWTHPVLFQRVERAKKRNPTMRVVLIDPRRTATNELADLHLAIKPGTDVALFNGLLNYVVTHGHSDNDYITRFTEGFEQACSFSQDWSPVNVASLCDINEQDLLDFYQLFAQQQKVLTAYSMGVNQSSSGVDKANAIINCHLATGKLGREGCGPFSLTGQPNAMGGREVGGLANMLACHMDIDNPQHRDLVQSYWQSPTIATQQGTKAVDLFEKINQGSIKAVWIMATNPVVSMPNRQKIEAALKKCELVVVSDCVANSDTLNLAHITLPAAGWSEKNGSVTNSERRISRQRGILPPFAESKHDWQIICDVAKAMGFEQGFNFKQVYEIFNEYTGLTQAENNGQRDLDLSGFGQLDERQYDALKPVQWPFNRKNPHGTQRLFTDGKFFTKSGKAQFVSLLLKLPEQQTSEQFPLILNTGRIRDQWHTMTRTGKTSELSAHISRPYIAMHPQDALERNLAVGDMLSLSAQHSLAENTVILPLTIDNKQRKGEVFAPIHWSLSNSSHGAIASLFTDANDAISGQPELKHAAVACQKVEFSFYGQLFIQQTLNLSLLRTMFEYFVEVPMPEGKLIYFATNKPSADIKSALQLNLPLLSEWFSASDIETQNIVAFVANKLTLVLFMERAFNLKEPAWISHLMAQKRLNAEQVNSVLSGKPDQSFNAGPLVCSCFKVGENTINQAIVAGCRTIDELGVQLKCGTNCGSCKSELSQMIKVIEFEASDTAMTKKLIETASADVIQLT